MSEKMTQELKTEHIENPTEVLKLEEARARTSVENDIPVREVLENHLDEDPKRLGRIRRKIDLRLTVMLAVLYTTAFLDRANLGNVSE